MFNSHAHWRIGKTICDMNFATLLLCIFTIGTSDGSLHLEAQAMSIMRECVWNPDNGARVGQQALKHIRPSIINITHTHPAPKECRTVMIYMINGWSVRMYSRSATNYASPYRWMGALLKRSGKHPPASK